MNRALSIWAVMAAVGLCGLLVGRPAEKTYPFQLGSEALDARAKEVFSNAVTLKAALMLYFHHLAPPNETDFDMVRFLSSPFGSFLKFNNPYAEGPAKVFSNPPAMAGQREYGNLALVMGSSSGWWRVEIRGFTPTLPDGKDYLYVRVPSSTRGTDLAEEKDAKAHLAERFNALKPRDRVVMMYSRLLEGSANRAQMTVLDGVKPNFGGAETLSELSRFWWIINPNAIYNPYTNQPVREVTLENAEPGEVTFLPIRRLRSRASETGSLDERYRPATLPNDVVVVGYGEDRLPVEPRLLLLAVMMRPKDLPPLPQEVVENMLPKELAETLRTTPPLSFK